MIDSGHVKELATKLGADLCGIAPSQRFEKAPEGFKPVDVYGDCRSVIVFAKKVPHAALLADSCIPYTHVSEIVTGEVDLLGVRLSLALEELGIAAVPVPSDVPLEHWEADRQYARGVLSMRHAGYLAGLGVLGKNTLLINEKYGNMIQIGAVLANVELEPDPLATYEGCITDCRKCIEACTRGALDGITVNQKLCRPLSNYVNERGFTLKKCGECRKACPHRLGLRRA